MSGILDGLSHLHAQKIIHRDLKPENVLLKGDVPCIVDFGVSRMVETVSLTSSQLGTNSAGSPLYMSPESFERTKPSPQIDIWSAGVMLFEMLSGKTPYTAETIPALIFEIVAKEPRELPVDVPGEMQKVVKKALSKDLSQRFSTAKEMRDALMRALYSKDSVPIISEEDFVSTQKRGIKKEEFRSSLAQTLQINNSSASQKTNGNKKAFVLAGIASCTVLAASIGILTLTQFSGARKSIQNNTAISNQPATVETGNNANFTAGNTIIDEPAFVPQNSTEAQILDKANRPPVESQKPAKTEVKSKSATQKSTPKPKKKVTLDELIGDSK